MDKYVDKYYTNINRGGRNISKYLKIRSKNNRVKVKISKSTIPKNIINNLYIIHFKAYSIKCRVYQ